MTEFFKDAAEYLPILLQGAKLTILVTLGSLVLSTLLGLVWALMRVSGNKYLSKFSAGVINLLRGIPILSLIHIWQGEQIGVVLKGTLELWVGDRVVLLKEGDSFCYASSTPRRWRNPGSQATEVIWAISNINQAAGDVTQPPP